MSVNTLEPERQERKYSPATLARNTTLTMSGRPPKGWPQWDQEKFVTVRTARDDRLIFAERQGVLRPVATSGVESAILKYWHSSIPFLAGWKLDKAQDVQTIRAARRWWELAVDPIDESAIKPVAFKSDPSTTFHRLPFDPYWHPGWRLEEKCPLFCEMFERITNAEPLAAWIGSLFDKKAPRQQYCWLVGRGGDGKGTLVRRLASLLGPSFATEYPPTRGDRFWTSGLLGKRLVIFPDMDNADFVTTGMFKSLSGGDKVRVEFKGGATVSVELPVMFMFVSNKVPTISLSPADQRRIILCEIEPPASLYDGQYEADLEKEVPLFISWCLDRYEQHRGKPQIECDTQGAENVARQTTAEWDMMIEHHFSRTGNEEDTVTGEQLDFLLLHYYRNSKRDRDAMRGYVRDMLGLKGEAPRRFIAGRRQRCYPGLFNRGKPPLT